MHLWVGCHAESPTQEGSGGVKPVKGGEKATGLTSDVSAGRKKSSYCIALREWKFRYDPTGKPSYLALPYQVSGISTQILLGAREWLHTMVGKITESHCSPSHGNQKPCTTHNFKVGTARSTKTTESE
jgi:hypothetical protein